MNASLKRVLVTGATGYVGGRLIPYLLESGYHIRAMGRSMKKLASRSWAGHHDVELVEADVFDLSSLKKACQECFAAYYLVHSMNTPYTSGKDTKFISLGLKTFDEADRIAAQNMRDAAASECIERLIFLGGLGEETRGPLSRHLKSRHEVAAILKEGPVPVTHLRAAMILGSGSASFEIMRYLVERMPVMFTPHHIKTLNQPIAIRNVLYYLRECLAIEKTKDRTFDIGGPDISTYKELFDIYAEEAGLKKRVIIPLPFVSPEMCANFIHLISPVPKAIAAPLTEGLRNPVICRDNSIKELIPQRLINSRETIRRALNRVRSESVETCWSDAGCLLPPEWVYCGDESFSGGSVLECGYKAGLNKKPDIIWPFIKNIGGQSGWYFSDYLWQLRGNLDRIMGGIGIKRGRRNDSSMRIGDALDFWRILEITPPKRLVLLAEMRVPGEAVLEFNLISVGKNDSEIQVLARFLPKGLMGMAYWYALFPAHQYLFTGLINSIAKRSNAKLTNKPRRFTPKIPKGCRLPEIF